MKEKLKKKSSYRNIAKEEKGGKQMQKNENKNRGITLIALVITIIVLIILAGIVIAKLTGDNGIIAKASSANKKQIEAEVMEKIDLAVEAAKLDVKSKITQGIYSAEEDIENITKIIGKDLNGNEELVSESNSYQLECSNSEGKIIITYGKAKTEDNELVISGGNEDYASVCNWDEAVIVAIINIEKNIIETIDVEGSGISKKNEDPGTIDLLTATASENEETTEKIKIKKNGVKVTSSAGVSAGDEVTIGEEHFYVIFANSTNIRLLAKYCIDLTTYCQVDEGYPASVTVFSGTKFWESRTINCPYDFPTEDYANEDNNALYASAKYGEKKGVTGRLLYYSEAISLINAFSDIMYGKNIGAPNNYLDYWLGSSACEYNYPDADSVSGSSNKVIKYGWAGSNWRSLYGVRPVLEILWANI